MNSHPDLESIFACSDQNALIHNFVANEDPPPGAWNYHSPPQSPLGRVSFPEILVFPRGDIFTLGRRRELVHNMTETQAWLPWAFRSQGPNISVERAVTRDIWVARVDLKKPGQGLAVFECRPKPGVNVTAARARDGMQFGWEGLFDMHLTFAASARRLEISDDPSSITRRFAGFTDPQINEDVWHNEAWKNNRSIWIGVQFRDRLDVQFSVVRAGKARPRRVNVRQAEKAECTRWREFFRDKVPALKSGDPVLRDTYYFAWQTLWSNRCEGGSAGGLEMPYISPSRLNYGSQWWWDEAFHLVIVRHLKAPKGIYKALENFWRAQEADGRIPGSIRFSLARKDVAAESVGHATMDMQPPVIGLILQLLKDKPGWPRKLRPIYESLLRWARWHLTPARDTDQDGLVEYHHSFDSSADQTQRWDSQLLEADKIVGQMRPTESVDCNVWMSLLWQELAEMAERLGEAEAAVEHSARARQLFALIDEHMWDERDGFYYDIDGETHVKIRVKTPYGFMPLLSPHIRPDRAERLVRDHLLNPREFWCRHPLPSVSLDHPKFDPRAMWRGPTWINVNWLVVEGLSRQGYHREARRLALKTIQLVGPRYRKGKRARSPRIWEWYDPHTGRELGNNQFSWSALVIDLILRYQGENQE